MVMSWRGTKGGIEAQKGKMQSRFQELIVILIISEREKNLLQSVVYALREGIRLSIPSELDVAEASLSGRTSQFMD